MTHVLVVDGSHWVREEDYREVERKLAEARKAWQDCREEFTALRQELDEARAALRDYSSALNVAYVPDMLQAMYDCERKHATALRAAREAG